MDSRSVEGFYGYFSLSLFVGGCEYGGVIAFSCFAVDVVFLMEIGFVGVLGEEFFPLC